MKKMFFIALIWFVCVGGLFGVFLAKSFFLWKGDDVWPAITHCRTCENRIWVWQTYDFRDYEGVGGGGMRLAGYVHNDCKTPKVIIKVINIRTIQVSSVGVGEHITAVFENLKLRPQEHLKGINN